MIVLRPYQEEAIKAIKSGLTVSKEFVLASCPSSGKTEIALEYIRQHPKFKFLVIPHGTTVIKTQWLKKSTGLTNVDIELPQSLHTKDLRQYDVVIIDEGHEFTEAKMIQTVIAKTKPKKILYLTGTPSKFIAKKVPMFVVAAEELVPTYISDLYFGLFSTSANIKATDYSVKNDTNELLKGREGLLARSAESDITALVEAMVKRLKATNFLKSRPLINKAGSFSVFGKIGKTMIACHNEKQLRVVEKTLLNRGVKVVVSISDGDEDSKVINGFEEDSNNVLLVLRRGILGYNMTNLVNVVDMTCSHTINRIYQLYARVMRQSEDHPHKYFFKLTSTHDMQVTRFFMNASIHLMRKDFISRYNGKNLNEMEVRVLKTKKDPREKEEGRDKPKPTGGAKVTKIDPIFEGIVKANEMLEDIWSLQSEVFNEYATMRIGKLKEVAFNIEETRTIKNITEEQFKKLIETGEVDEMIYG